MSPRKVQSFVASLDTDVPVSRSIDQIRAHIERFGASEFGIQYSSHRPVGISFRVRDPNLGEYLPVSVRAPCEHVLNKLIASTRQSLRSDVQQRLKEQAERVAWRNLHDFVRASLIAVETGIMSLGEAFMASLMVTHPTTGETRRLGEIAAEGGLVSPGKSGTLMLGSGP